MSRTPVYEVSSGKRVCRCCQGGITRNVEKSLAWYSSAGDQTIYLCKACVLSLPAFVVEESDGV